jgi:hypothetical protein
MATTSGASRCSDYGNKGLIVNFLRDNARQIDINEIQLSTDTIVYSFGTTTLPPRGDNGTGYISVSSQNTIICNGISYKLESIQLGSVDSVTARYPNGPGGGSAMPMAELILVFTKDAAVEYGEERIAMRFPIYYSSEAPPTLASMLNTAFTTRPNTRPGPAWSLDFLFKEGLSGNMIEYITCVNGKQIKCIIYPGMRLYVDGSSFLGEYITGRRFYNKAGQLQTVPPLLKFPTLIGGELNRKPPTTTLTVQNTTRLTEKPTSSGSKAPATLAKKLHQYKCVPIDVMKDIEGNSLRIDPLTGEKIDLKDVKNKEEAQLALLLPTANSGKLRKTIDTFMILLITLACIILVLLAFTLISKWNIWHKSKNILPQTGAVTGASGV